MIPRIGKVQVKISFNRPQVLNGINHFTINADRIEDLVFVRPKLTLRNDKMNWMSQRELFGVDLAMLIIDVTAVDSEACLAMIVVKPDAR